ncbi:hypothetical protein AGMMS50284_4440 [Clostridia bacterium]|nr:hypothetical protein AGMMS50284_4440 [Clostridia bacterium]
MNNYSLSLINIPPEEFLRPFFAVDEKVRLRVFSDQPDSAFSGMKLEVRLEDFADIVDILKSHNDQGRGIYFVINYGGHEDADISRINAQFMECDEISLEEQLEKIKVFPLEPSLIVKTRKSLHCYWLMKKAEVGKFRSIQKRLIAQFGADPACINESRVFRLPGFFHCKQEPLMVECIKFNPELRYTQEQLEAILPEIAENTTAPAPVSTEIRDCGTQKGIALLRTCPFMKYCHTHAKNLSEPLWYAMITNMSLFEGGTAAIHKMSKPYPRYSQQATDAKITHFHKTGTKPITCRRIAEQGFTCPRLESCGCKSPAGLAFRPLALPELKKLLTKQKKTNDPAGDVQLAAQFVSEYLFNQEPTLAETFIKYDLRSFFGFKSEDCRPLVAAYKEMYSKFAELRDTHKEKSNLDEWYEFTKAGGLRFMPGILANYLAKKLDAFYCTEQYYYYERGVYQPRNDKDAKATVRTFLNPRDVTMNQINDAENQWQLLIRKPIREINPNQFVINAQNGLYNVLNDSFCPHDPTYFSTVQLKANYDPTAECPIFLRFLNESLDPAEVNLMQEIFGYFLVPITKAQKSFMLCGEPNVGKSKILQVLQEVLLGAENVSNIPLQNLSDRFQPAELFGKLANIYADLADKSLDDAGMFKAVTGEDYITGERKHKDPFSFKPYARFLYSCNDIPRNYGDRSEAFYRRLIIIRFERPVPEERRDPQLFEKMALEGDSILAWAIAGLKRLIANNYIFTETEKTRGEVKRYKIQNNSVLAFVEEMCVVDPDAEGSTKEMFAAFQLYCEENGIKKSAGIGKFVNDISSLPGVKASKDSRSRRSVFKGVRLA